MTASYDRSRSSCISGAAEKDVDRLVHAVVMITAHKSEMIKSKIEDLSFCIGVVG